MEKFRLEENGYNREDVNQFIKEVIIQTEKMNQKIIQQQEENKTLKQKLEDYNNLEDNVKSIIIKTEEISTEIKNSAKKEKEQIILEAKQNASTIINEALLDAEKVELKAKILKKNINIIKTKLSFILEEQMSIIKEIDNIELEDEN